MKKVINLGTHSVVIENDTDSENPRQWAYNLGTCIFFHSRYNFGDDHNIDADDYNSFDDMLTSLVKNDDVVVALPVYLFDHSGITISTAPFGCRWDSGQLGLIVAYRGAILGAYGVKRITKKIKERVERLLRSEIETLDQYIRGDVYGFNTYVNPDAEELDGEKLEDFDFGTLSDSIDSCWGFYGDNEDNGIFDQLDIEGLTPEKYAEAYTNAYWSY